MIIECVDESGPEVAIYNFNSAPVEKSTRPFIRLGKNYRVTGFLINIQGLLQYIIENEDRVDGVPSTYFLRYPASQFIIIDPTLDTGRGLSFAKHAPLWRAERFMVSYGPESLGFLGSVLSRIDAEDPDAEHLTEILRNFNDD